MKYSTILLTGVPHKVRLIELSYCLDRLFDTDEIGTFKLRDLPYNSSNKRQIALDFRSGFDAIAAQERLHGYHYELPDGKEYTLCAKITWKEEYVRQGSVSPEPWRSDESSERCPSMSLVPIMSDGAVFRASAKLDAQLELLKKQKLLIQTEREVLREKRKLEREYSSKCVSDSDDEPTTSKQGKESSPPSPQCPATRGPDPNESTSPPKLAFKLKAKKNSKEPKTEQNVKRSRWDIFDINPKEEDTTSKCAIDKRSKSQDLNPQIRLSDSQDEGIICTKKSTRCSTSQIAAHGDLRLKIKEKASDSARSKLPIGYRSRSRERVSKHRSRSRERGPRYRSRSRERVPEYRSKSRERVPEYRSRSRERGPGYRSRSRECVPEYRSSSRERGPKYKSRSREWVIVYKSRPRERGHRYRRSSSPEQVRPLAIMPKSPVQCGSLIAMTKPNNSAVSDNKYTISNQTNKATKTKDNLNADTNNTTGIDAISKHSDDELKNKTGVDSNPHANKKAARNYILLNSSSETPDKNKVIKESAGKEKDIAKIKNIGNDIMYLMHRILKEILETEQRTITENQKRLIDGILSARVLNRIKPFVAVKDVTELQVVLNYRELYSKEEDTQLILKLLDEIPKETSKKDPSDHVVEDIPEITNPDDFAEIDIQPDKPLTSINTENVELTNYSIAKKKVCRRKKKNKTRTAVIETGNVQNENIDITNINFVNVMCPEQITSNCINITEVIEIADNEIKKETSHNDESNRLEPPEPIPVIDLVFDNQNKPIPTKPHFVLVMKKLMKQMKNAINTADKCGLRNFPMSMFKCALKSTVKELIAGKGYLSTCRIVKHFREKYPKEKDDIFVNQIVRDVKMGKYGKYVDGVISDEKDDVVLIETKYDVITVLDSDDEVDSTPENPCIVKVEPIEKELETMEYDQPESTLKRRAQGVIVKTEPNHYPTTVANEMPQVNVEAEPSEKINGTPRVNNDSATPVAELYLARLPEANIDGKTVSQTGNNEVLTTETDVKQEIEPEFTDAAVSNLLDSLKNFDILHDGNDNTEKETPQVTAITIMTSFSELISLKNELNEGSHKVDIENTDKKLSGIKSEIEELPDTVIKTECIENNEQGEHENMPTNNEEDHNKEREETDEKHGTNKAKDMSSPAVVDNNVVCTANAKTSIREDEEESIESITKYVESVCK